jgi:hypothetical protein
MLPDALLLKLLPEELGELLGGVLAVHGGSGVLGDHDVGLLEVGVGLEELGPVGSVGGAPGFAVAVEAVDEDDDAGLGVVSVCRREERESEDERA